ncbi:MAG: [CysO sulfur-carrier protein]-S-L-cysteine hydrolase [Acidimicrobiaceae bacterium]|nr:[CysO sulfur-carrier protein]-S-L-cysteine hydrolase [Acidimicrobiaceae bacterium]MDQ1445056.1 [CysO sulfur-carrier protein]-S-L-cysteine hydrolase [Acidimicrobiaceae bacterium]
MLRLAQPAYQRMVGHCLDGLPLEACGLLGGHVDTAKADVCYPCRNEAQSAKLYSIGIDYMHAERDADARGIEIIGVFHSHTHTDPYPSPTDIAQAVDPAWHYVIVSLRDTAPMVRSYRIVDGTVVEEPVVVEGR